MEDRELIEKIQLLKTIEPSATWVLSVKRRILDSAFGDTVKSEEVFVGAPRGWFSSAFQFLEKPAFVFSALSVLVSGGVLFQTSRVSVPGDSLYALRSSVERTKILFASEQEKSFGRLAAAQNRLADLKTIAKNNQVENLSPAISDFENSMKEASTGLAKLVKEDPTKASQVSKELVSLMKNKQEVETILGVKIGGSGETELQDLAKTIVADELATLAKATLTEEQAKILAQAKASYDSGNYQEALQSIWTLSQRNQNSQK